MGIGRRWIGLLLGIGRIEWCFLPSSEGGLWEREDDEGYDNHEVLALGLDLDMINDVYTRAFLYSKCLRFLRMI